MYKLRPYQSEAVQRAIEFFQKKRDPAVIVLPTGAGKSLVIAELAKIAKGRVLVLAHVKELVEQNFLKYTSYDLEAGIYSAGLNLKESSQKVIFGSIQSVANANENFFDSFTLLIIDECHRVNAFDDTQYSKVIKTLKEKNDGLCILGLTATPYRLGTGWIYEFNQEGELKTQENKFFKQCVFELPLEYMVRNKYLTPPVKVDIPVTCYDFSEIIESGRNYTNAEIEDILKRQKRLTPLIIKNIIDIVDSYDRRGVMIFCSTVNHAKEILEYLPADDAKIVIGDTSTEERDKIIQQFKDQQFKYLVNVSVLTTGFDAPHVDVIAILRPTDSTSLYQQIIGRGLRLYPGKKDCFVLDYAGIGHNIYAPQISDKKPNKNSVPVIITCPKCEFDNNFWGILNEDGEVIEHYGRKCRGATQDKSTMEIKKCGFRFRYKVCNQCGQENDITAKECERCHIILFDPDSAIKQAKLSKDAHILKPDTMIIEENIDKKGVEFLEVKYFDVDGDFLSERHYINSKNSLTKFKINFLRSHLKLPELIDHFQSQDDAVKYQKLFRLPFYIIARKQNKFWRVTEKIFAEEL